MEGRGTGEKGEGRRGEFEGGLIRLSPSNSLIVSAPVLPQGEE